MTHTTLDEKGKPQIVTVHHPVLISNKSELPTIAEMAKGNPIQTATALADLERQQAEMQKQIDELRASQKAGK